MIRTKHIDISVFQKVKHGNVDCGDSYFYYQEDDYFICVIVDGLGSGTLANESSQAVVNVIKSNPFMSITEMIRLSNHALIGKRGVVLGILQLNLKTEQFTYSSIGNIGLMTINSDGRKRRNIPMSGYLGGYLPKAKVINGTFKTDTIFIMFSDGVLAHELTDRLFDKQSVYEITEAFASKMEPTRDDDTTLAVMKYI